MRKFVCMMMAVIFLLGIMAPQMVLAEEQVVPVTNDPHSGAGVLVLNCPGTESWGVHSVGMNNLTRNTDYTVSYWIKGEAGVSAVTRVVTTNWKETIKSTSVKAPSEEWTQMSMTYHSGNNTQLTLALMDNSTVAGKLYFDDFSIARTDGAPSNAAVPDPGFEENQSIGSYGSILYFDNRASLFKNGRGITKLEAGDIEVSMDFYNMAGNFPNVCMVAALYQGQTCIRAVTSEQKTVAKNHSVPISLNIRVEEEDVENGAYMQVMLWDSAETMMPVCDGKTVINGQGTQHGLFYRKCPAPQAEYKRGVNLAGAEFGDYSMYNQEEDFKYYAGKGFEILRVPIKWEQMQPQLFGALREDEIRNLKNNADWARKYGAQIIIDVHNYSSYNGEYIGMSDTVTMEAFNDLWRRLSDVFKDHDGVYGYDIMNEPSGKMKATTWRKVSQSCVDAIRANGDSKLILIEGVGYSGAGGWPNANQAAHGPWIEDPIDNIMYSAHCYFDADNSGTYKKTLEEELGGRDIQYVINRALNRLTDFTDWCQKFGVRGHLGEFGVPGRAEDDERWMLVLDAFLQQCDETGMDTTYWAGGRYWGNYPLSCQPTNNYQTDTRHMEILLKHLPE